MPPIDDARQKIQRINETVLSDETAYKNLRKRLPNLNTTSQNFAAASKRIDAVVTDAQSAVKAGQKTMLTTLRIRPRRN